MSWMRVGDTITFETFNAVRRIICRVDSPLGNPPQLRQTVIDVVRMWLFAVAKPPYVNYQFNLGFNICKPAVN